MQKTKIKSNQINEKLIAEKAHIHVKKLYLSYLGDLQGSEELEKTTGELGKITKNINKLAGLDININAREDIDGQAIYKRFIDLIKTFLKMLDNSKSGTAITDKITTRIMKTSIKDLCMWLMERKPTLIPVLYWGGLIKEDLKNNILEDYSKEAHDLILEMSPFLLNYSESSKEELYDMRNLNIYRIKHNLMYELFFNCINSTDSFEGKKLLYENFSPVLLYFNINIAVNTEIIINNWLKYFKIEGEFIDHLGKYLKNIIINFRKEDLNKASYSLVLITANEFW